MPYLNWKSSPLKQEVKPRPNRPGEPVVMGSGADSMSMELEISAEALAAELLPSLKGTFEEGGGELRVDLPQEWSLFWKLREGESRALIAHPAKDQWVGTL